MGGASAASDEWRWVCGEVHGERRGEVGLGRSPRQVTRGGGSEACNPSTAALICTDGIALGNTMWDRLRRHYSGGAGWAWRDC